MSRFLRTLSGELQKLCAQRPAWLGFGAALVIELVCLLLLQFSTVRALAEGDYQRAHLDFVRDFSGLTVAAHLVGQTMMLTGALFLALVAADLVAGEAESGTLRMLLCRPVRRESILLQKLFVCAAYTAVLCAFISLSSLGLGLLFEGSGPLHMVLRTENVLGSFAFREGLVRYALATVLLIASMWTVSLFAFAMSCFPVKPAAAAAVALTIFLAESALRQMPAAGSIRPYLLLTCLMSWLHAFDTAIPFALLQRNYTTLACVDAGLVALAWLAFRRREFKG